MSNENRTSPLLHILTPFILLALCAGIAILVCIKPADKLKVFFNLAFMDDLKADPNDDSGLVIRSGDIVTDYSGKTSDTGEIIQPKFGELYAILKCDKLASEVPVYWGTGAELLELGACQNIGSVVAGKDGNSVISAHVDTFFGDLDSLKKDDIITIETNYGRFTYTVRKPVTFDIQHCKPIMPSEENILTVYTCQKGLISDPDVRVGFVCDLTKSEFYSAAGGDAE